MVVSELQMAAEFLVMAHRGASWQVPGNTLEAFECAIKMGANVIETDVHWTRDGVLVIAHDDKVDAVSEGTGFISDLTYAELRKLDFGYRFTRDGGETFPYRGKGIRIPTFNELLSSWPSIKINVDLKAKIPHVSAFLRLVDDHHALDDIVLASFHHRTLVEARRRQPKLATSASTREVVSFMLRQGPIQVRKTVQHLPYVALQVPSRVWGRPFVNQRFVTQAHAAGVQVHVWTVNERTDMEQLLAYGVDGIVTDCPDRLLEILKNRA